MRTFLLTAAAAAMILVLGPGTPAEAVPPPPASANRPASTLPAVGDVSSDAVNVSNAHIDRSRLGQTPARRNATGGVAAAEATLPTICPPTLTEHWTFDRFNACIYAPLYWTVNVDGVPTYRVDFTVEMWVTLANNSRIWGVHAIITPTELPVPGAVTVTPTLSCSDLTCISSASNPPSGVFQLGLSVVANFAVSDEASTAIVWLNHTLNLNMKVAGLTCEPCVPATVKLGTNAPIRCDSVFKQSGYQYGGCVFWAHAPRWAVSDGIYPGMGLVAKHMAIATGDLPGYNGLPGDPGRHTPLTFAGGRQAENYQAACGSLTPPPAEAARGNTSCDEYPFASTYQGAASGDPYSICWVTPAQNSSQGANFGWFTVDNRVLDGDQFYVDASYGGNAAGCDNNLGGGGSVTPDNALNNMFGSYGDRANCANWSGGDATNSVVLPDGQRAWFFSDSYLNSPTQRKGLWYASSLHNSIVVQNSGGIRKTMTGGNVCQETNQFLSFWDRYAKTPAASDDGFYWTSDQRVVGSNVVKFYYHGHSVTLPGGGGSFEIDYSAVAAIPVGTLQGDATVVTINPVRFSCGSSTITWGTALVDWNGAVYVYGWQPAAAGDRIYVAKTSAAGLTNPASWQVYTGMSGSNPVWGGCGSSPAALPIVKGTTGFSVVPVNNSLWLVQFDYTNGQLNAAGSIGAHPSSTPWGFTDRTVALYTPPKTGVVQYPYFYQQYEARVQPGLGAAGQVVISYNVNTSAVDTGCVSANAHDARIYRPRFIDVPSSLFDAAAANAAPSTTTSMTGPRKATNPLSSYGIRNSGPPFATDHPPVMPASTTASAAATGIDGSTDWFEFSLGGHCPSIGGPASAPATSVDDHGIVATSWQSPGTDVWYYPWICDRTTYSCSPQGTQSPWMQAWPTGNGPLWTTGTSGYLAPIDLTTSPGYDTNGHRFAIFIQSFGAGNASGGGYSPETILTVSR
jgi:hypothetical protein